MTKELEYHKVCLITDHEKNIRKFIEMTPPENGQLVKIYENDIK